MNTTKKMLRQKVQARLKLLSDAERTTFSAQARTLLERQPAWRTARSIFFYAPMPEELDVWPLVRDSLAAGKVVCLPRFDAATNRYVACQVQDLSAEVVSGKLGIREPCAQCVAVPLNRLDLVLVPGIAFDSRGHRLGRGKGYYDQLLAHATGLKCGVAFDEQIVGDILVEPHDVSMDCMLTPTRWLEFKV